MHIVITLSIILPVNTIQTYSRLRTYTCTRNRDGWQTYCYRFFSLVEWVASGEVPRRLICQSIQLLQSWSTNPTRLWSPIMYTLCLISPNQKFVCTVSPRRLVGFFLNRFPVHSASSFSLSFAFSANRFGVRRLGVASKRWWERLGRSATRLR